MLSDKAIIRHIESLEFLFVRDGGDLFFDKVLDKDLRCTIRISVEFYHFLQRLPTTLSQIDSEIEYMNGTIRSGLGCFYEVQAVAKILNEMPERAFKWDVYGSLADLKKDYERLFNKIRENDLTIQGRVVCLIDLIRIEIIFLGTTFI